MVYSKLTLFFKIILISFLLLIFSFQNLGLSEQVASVDNRKISFEKFKAPFDQARKLLEAETPIDASTEEGKKLLLITAQSIIQELVNEAIVEIGASKLGINVSDDEVKKEITQFKSTFQNDAEFDESLKNQNISFEELKENIREKILKEKIMEQLSKNITISTNEMKSYYQKNLSRYVTPEKIELNHILVFSELRGKEVLEAIKGGLSFFDAVRKFSEDSLTKTSGGYLGFKKKKDFPEEIGNLIFQLQPGEISPLIKTNQGYEIFQCVSRQPKRIFTFNQVKSKIKKTLYENKKEAVFKKWFEELKKEAKIEINDSLISNYIFKNYAEKK